LYSLYERQQKVNLRKKLAFDRMEVRRKGQETSTKKKCVSV
jgi:hypothetical protein